MKKAEKVKFQSMNKYLETCGTRGGDLRSMYLAACQIGCTHTESFLGLKK